MSDTTVFPTRLTRGQRFTAVTTGVSKDGERIYHQLEFTASRDQDVEQFFIPVGEGRPAQDRIFVEHPHGSVPQLVVAGSIKAIA